MRLLKADPWLLGPVLFLLSAGLVTQASISTNLFVRELIWIAMAITLIFAFSRLNLRAVFSYKWVVLGIYVVGLLLLIITYFIAPSVRGHHSWINIGAFQLQPSEFMKAALIILLSRFFALRHTSIANLSTIAISFVYFLVPTLLVLLQPDTGTALVFFAIWFGYLLISGIPWKYLLMFFLSFAVIGLLAWNFGLQPYQKNRIHGLFNPSYDPLGANYNVIQAKIAVGSAGFFGKGFEQGTQVQLGFLPAASTDFAFSAFTEEWGVFGALLLISAFLILIVRILKIGMASEDNFSRFICIGTVIFLMSHFVINLGSNLGMLPVIGIGLPLVSYGGSNLLTVAFLIGIIKHIAERAAF